MDPAEVLPLQVVEGGGEPIPGIVSDEGMYIRLGQNSQNVFTSYISKDGVFGSDCSIPSTGLNQYIECNIDILEWDMYFFGYELEINVPRNLCEFASFEPYWYYHHEVGDGPKSITITTKEDNDGQITDYSCQVDGEDPPNDAKCTGFLEVSININESILTCTYDNTQTDGPNCCFGDFVLTTNRTTTDEDGNENQPLISTTEETWGGNMGNCIAGAALSSGWRLSSETGLPAREYYHVLETGLNNTYNFISNIGSVRSGNNLHGASYYNKTGSPHYHGGFSSQTTRTSNLPYAIDPIDDRNGTEIRAAQDAYELTCYDEGHEVKNKIRLFIREWSTVQEFLLYGSSSGANGNPDIDGIEGVDCEYNPPFPYAGYCNDRADWKDLLNIVGGTYDTSDPSNRATFFPGYHYRNQRR